MSNDAADRIKNITGPDDVLLTYYIFVSLLSGPLFPILIFPLYFKYQTLQYEFDDEGVSMSWGVLWKTEISVSYSRIQDIHISRGLLERWMGLGTIQVQTASGAAGAELTIVGLKNYEEVRDFFYSKMRGARFGEDTLEAEKKNKQEPATAELEEAEMKREDNAEQILSDIRDELRKLREQITPAQDTDR